MNDVTYRVSQAQLTAFNRYGKKIDITASGSVSLDLTAGDLFNILLDASSTISTSNFGTAPISFLLRVKQGSAGSNTLGFSNQFKFANGISPAIGPLAGDIEWFVGHHIDAGIIELMKADGPIVFPA
jgi:hypothetical protein